MIDIVIKNGKLPPNCWDCKYEPYHVPDCPCWNGMADASNYRQSRYPFCPIKELSEHGDLIDRSKLVLHGRVDDFGDLQEMNDYYDATEVMNAPTILEASEVKHD